MSAAATGPARPPLESAAGTTYAQFEAFADARGPFALLLPAGVRAPTFEAMVSVAHKLRPETRGPPATLSLSQLYAAIGCQYVEMVSHPSGSFVALCDEGGAARTPNYLAAENLVMCVPLRGPIVVCPDAMFA